MLKSIPLPAVLIDVETTGGNVAYDRITEIGIIEIDENGMREWSTLINPGMKIPPGIQRLTGITDAMVAQAPRFEQVAKEILLRIKDKLFIAHNVRFDYGFVRNEFSRLAYSFKASLLCSVKISRALYADCDGHSLEKIIRRHQIFVTHRHRALDDARATFRFLQIAEAEKNIEACQAAVKSQMRRASIPVGLAPDIVADLPVHPGVYYFWGAHNELLYIGKSINIRKRVLAHFSSDHKTSKEMRICQQTCNITWERTAGELGALILESQKIKTLQPIFNRKLRRTSNLYSIFLQENSQGWLVPQIISIADMQSAAQKMHGLFPSVKKAKEAISLISDEHTLCYYAAGLEKISTRVCTARQLKKCSGLCEGHEHYLAHNIKMLQGFHHLALKTWPYKGAVALIEQDDQNDRREYIVINNWCVLGIAASAEDCLDIINNPSAPQLDKDIYRYLISIIFKKSSRYKIHSLESVTERNSMHSFG